MSFNADEKYQAINIPDDESISSDHSRVSARSSPTHCHVPNNKADSGTRTRLIAVLVLCVIFMMIEIVGGILSNSIAIMTDAAHMGIDAASFLISLSAIYLSRRPPTQRLSFGYIRAEVLGALVSVLIIWVVTGILVYLAILRCIDQRFEVQPTTMIIVASCGVLFNIIMFLVLHLNTDGQSISHHGHSHGNQYEQLNDRSHMHSHNNNQQSKSSNHINIRAAMIHVIGDFVQSIGVLCAAIVIKIKPEYKLADPICTFIFSVLVFVTTITIIRDIALVLMEAIPANINYTQIVDHLLQIPGVRNVHSLHIWSLSMQEIVLSVHVAIDSNLDCLTVLNDAQEILRREHSVTRATIQIELYDEQIMSSCENCLRPSN